MGKVWEEKKPIGDRCEKILDTFFTGKGLSVKKVGEETDRLGIDRIFENSSGMKYSVEYKSDLKAKTTGNFFVELRQRNKNDGWAYSCIAQRLVLFIPGRNELYILRTERLKDQLDSWKDKFPIRECGQAEGIIVPIQVLAAETNAKRMIINGDL